MGRDGRGGRERERERDMSLGPDAQRRVLRIKRFVDGEWKLEIVRDPAVITAYLKKRQAIEEENTTADALAPTGDADRDRRAKKRCAERVSLLPCLLLQSARPMLTVVRLLQDRRGDCTYEKEPGTSTS